MVRQHKKGYQISEETRKKMIENHKGMTGMHHSEESKRKMSLARKGRIVSEETKIKLRSKRHSEETKKIIRLALKGRKFSDETIRKMSEAKKGTRHSQEWKENHSKQMSGKNNPMYGKKHSKETRAKISKAREGRSTGLFGEKNHMFGKVSAFKGRKHTKESIEKQRNAKKGKIPWNKGKTGIYSEQTLEKIREARSKQVFKTEESNPEKMVQLALRLKGIQFVTQKLVRLPKSYHKIDIFIEPNICIEVDGDYHHANPEKYSADHVMWKTPRIVYAKDIWARDIAVNHFLNQKGYQVIRIWTSVINANIKGVSEKIFELIERNKTSYSSRESYKNVD